MVSSLLLLFSFDLLLFIIFIFFNFLFKNLSPKILTLNCSWLYLDIISYELVIFYFGQLYSG